MSRAKPAGAQAYVYRATSSGDNLWDIAGAVVGSGGGATAIDRNQVMVAIFRANPQAFPEGNLHRIQRGLDLTIPSLADIRREERSRAATLVAQHRSAYADRRLKPVALYALSRGSVPAEASPAGSASAGSGSTVEAASASAVAELPEAPAAVGSSRAGWWLAGAAALLALGVAVLRLWWRRPLALDPLELEPSMDAHASPDPAVDEAAAAAEDERRAQAVAASLYAEDLEPSSAPAVAALAGEDDVLEPIALSATDPAVAANLAKSLAEAYEELDRPQAAKTWRARGEDTR
jgi:pilus assembly protein FimV